MVRFNPEKTDEVREKEGATSMDFTNKVMKSFAFVDIAALNTKKRLEYWIDFALEYNKLPKPSKKRENNRIL